MNGEDWQRESHQAEPDDVSSDEHTEDLLPDHPENTETAEETGSDSKIGRAIRASAERTAQNRDFVKSAATDADDSALSKSRAVGKTARHDVLGPPDSPYAASVALPVHYDGPQLVGVTVSAAGAQAPEAIGIADFGVILKRNLRTIVLMVLLLTGLSGLALALATPQYTAATDILLGSGVTANRGTETILSGIPDDEASIQSQASLLKSNDLALRVIDKMGLESNPEFAADDDVSSVADTGGFSAATMHTLEKFSKRLGVEHVPGTRVVTLTFSAADPDVASGTTNAIAELYIQDQSDSKYGAIDDTAKWLTSRVSELRRKVAAAELDLENFKLQAGITERDGMTLSDRELSNLNAQLIESRARTMEARTRLREIRSLLATPNGIDSAAEVLDSNLIQRLRERESELLADMAELGADLGNKHPRLLQMQAEVSQVRRKIDQETAKIVSALEYEYNIARARESAITSSLASTTGRLEVSADAVVQLNALEREVAADRLLLETLLGQLKQVGSQLDFSSQEPDARIISRALAPVDPSFPKFGSMLFLAALGSVLLAFMFVLIRDIGDRTIRTERQLADELNVIPVGIIPRVTRRQRRSSGAFQYAVDQPRSRYAAAVRAMTQKIQTAIHRVDGGTIMTTAATHGEGKSSVASSLANALSLQGRTAILIDADYISPRLHDYISVASSPGLIDVLERKADLKDAVYAVNSKEPFVFMPIGDRNLLRDGGMDYAAMEEQFVILKEHFDYIIIDAPPLLIGEDALILGRMMDASVLAMRWGKTHRRTAKNCAERLTRTGCKIVGGVLTDVNLSKYELYEYGQKVRFTKAASGAYSN